MNVGGIARASLLLAAAAIVQQTILDAVRIGTAHPDVLLVLPVMAGYNAGPERGATFGFAAGLVADLFVPTTFGLSALVFALVGFGVGVVTAGLVRGTWWLPCLISMGATAIGVVAYAILLSVINQTPIFTSAFMTTLVVVPLSGFVLALPVLRLITWAVPPPAVVQGAHQGPGSW